LYLDTVTSQTLRTTLVYYVRLPLTIKSELQIADVRIVKKTSVIDIWNGLPSTVNFASLMTFRQTIADVDLSNYIKSTS